MDFKAPEFSDSTWVGAGLGALGALASILGIGALFWHDPKILMALGIGAGWALVVALLVINAWQRQRIKELDVDLADARRQASAFADASKSVAEASYGALNTVRAAVSAEPAPPRRPRRPKE